MRKVQVYFTGGFTLLGALLILILSLTERVIPPVLMFGTLGMLVLFVGSAIEAKLEKLISPTKVPAK